MNISDDLPLVSIITPSFNQGRFIRDTIESVLSQDYPKLEYLVMDGGSTDETIDILRSYGDRVTWRSGPDGGQADAVNAGVRLAQGEILGWLNSDDTYLPGAVTTAVNYLLAQPETAVAYGNAYFIDEHNIRFGTHPTEDFDLNRLAESTLICQPAAFIRRSAFEAVGMLDPSLHYCMDYDLFIRLSRRFSIERIDRFLANSRRHYNTKSIGNWDGLFQEIYAVAERSFGYVSPHWRACRTYYRLTTFSWPLTRWFVWPVRRLLSGKVHNWFRRRLPVLLNRGRALGANRRG